MNPLSEDVPVILSSLPGEVMIPDRGPSGCDSYQVNISCFAGGIYIIRLTADGNPLFTDRIAK